MVRETKSAERSFLGLWDWDERRVAEIILRRFGDEAYLVEGVEFAELRAPLGRWHVQEDSPTVFQDLTDTKDLADILSRPGGRFPEGAGSDQVFFSVTGVER